MYRVILPMCALLACAPALRAASENPTTPQVACHASFTLTDARSLAMATPNSRAFVENFGATLRAEIQSQTATAVNVAVVAEDAQHGETSVGVYTVSLRTGHVTDDDMEPAEDVSTAVLRAKLQARHCTTK